MYSFIRQKKHNNNSKTQYNKKPSITVKDILIDNWDNYKETHSIEDYQLKEVEKAISCYDNQSGCFSYYCEKCDKHFHRKLGCNSRLCSCCGKRYNDAWSECLSKAMFDVPHRHIVLSVPDKLWNFLDDWNHRKIYMNGAIAALNDYFSKIVKKQVKVGVIVVLHPYGKDMKKQPHLHLLITEGAFDENGKFYPKKYIPANGFRKTWQYHIMKLFQANGLNKQIASEMFRKYPKGFYVWVHKNGRIVNPRMIAKYIGRYIRHPAIANSRIIRYDGVNVWFYYVDNESETITVKMTVNNFIAALIQHIPPPQFKMIRYYGAYARRSKKKYGLSILQSSIRQRTLKEFGFKELEICPECKGSLKFIGYYSKGPPKHLENQQSLKRHLL